MAINKPTNTDAKTDKKSNTLKNEVDSLYSVLGLSTANKEIKDLDSKCTNPTVSKNKNKGELK